MFQIICTKRRTNHEQSVRRRLPETKKTYTWLFFASFNRDYARVFIYPILLTFFYSFTNLALTGEAARELKFIGLDNYTRMFQDPTVRISIWNTLVFLIGSAVIGQQVLGFLIALLMKQRNKTFRRVIGTIVLAGWVTPEIVCALCLYSFFGDEGTLNAIITFWIFGSDLAVYRPDADHHSCEHLARHRLLDAGISSSAG